MKIGLLGAGYLGSELIQVLSAGHSITALDHGRHYENILRLPIMHKKDVTLMKGDITRKKDLEKLAEKCDVLINLTGGGGNAACTKDPKAYVDTYVIGTRLLADTAEKFGIRHIFHSSTISVYPAITGNSAKPLDESVPPGPATIYGVLKLASERILEEHSVNYTILRLSNIYGYTSIHALPEGGFMGNAIRSVFRRTPIQIHGTGYQKIDYIHISDVCNCFRLLLDQQFEKKAVYNIGSGTPMTLTELADLILRIAKTDFDIRGDKDLVPYEGPVIDYPQMSIEKITKECGWLPQVILSDGLEDVMEKYHKEMMPCEHTSP
ncbi:MAG: NAD(P)-dependent oxidoreductase [Deltaproteobacteria bacterium]|nr:NAD(P)-dependent oxidoreductase [Deltaproteobacteria bacterium]